MCIRDSYKTPLISTALRRAARNERLVPGAIFHTDRGSNTPRSGSPSTSTSRASGPRSAASAIAYDNALMESINGLYKAECIRTTVFHDRPYKTIADVEYATAGWVDWYNNRRLHSSLGNVPPVEFKQAHYAALNREPQPA